MLSKLLRLDTLLLVRLRVPERQSFVTSRREDNSGFEFSQINHIQRRHLRFLWVEEKVALKCTELL
jgi:hypothetical protein